MVASRPEANCSYSNSCDRNDPELTIAITAQEANPTFFPVQSRQYGQIPVILSVEWYSSGSRAARTHTTALVRLQRVPAKVLLAIL